jgi:uncharacterized protein (TIGR02118 family)
VYKVAWIARYPTGMSRQEASDYWAGHHGPTMKKVSPLAGYVQSHVQGPLPAVSGVAEEETLFDGYSCAWWNDRADFQQAMTTPAWQRVVEDGPNVFDMDWLWNMSAHRRVRHVGGRGRGCPERVRHDADVGRRAQRERRRSAAAGRPLKAGKTPHWAVIRRAHRIYSSRGGGPARRISAGNVHQT